MASPPDPPSTPALRRAEEAHALYVRQWATITVVAAAATPAPVLRLLTVTGAPHPDLAPLLQALIFGLGILAAATLLTWASEVAETEVSATLALVGLALIAVLPEYAVDLYFAWTAPTNPDSAHLAVANMTGANRLLVGLAWPTVFLIFFWRLRRTTMPVASSNSLGILFLGAATLYSFSIPIRGNLSLIDTAVMFVLFGAYLYLSSRQPPDEDRTFVGPAAALGALPKLQRRLAVGGIFLFAAAVIFAAAEPFAKGLVDTGKDLGVDEFLLVQWVAPLASEAPEFILAGMLAARGRHDAGMTVLISSKVNQWTLLIGSLPLAYSISAGTLSPLDFNARQAEEVFLTAGQSLFAVAILVSLSIAWWEALTLGTLFATQFFFTDTSIRVGYGGAYSALAVLVLARDVPRLPRFFSAARETAVRPREAPEGTNRPIEEAPAGRGHPDV
ncbi:MAG TPA: sodium:calcium antiporter [Dehalococcoidia bacterium]|nr:sodium:calcium antiporter [Dehalococcoidia bacterium]